MAKQYSKEQIFDKLKEILANDFEVEAEKITLSTNVFSDLDFDSIDAVDLAVRLQQFTNKKISPAEFKEIRTLEDVVNTIYNLID